MFSTVIEAGEIQSLHTYQVISMPPSQADNKSNKLQWRVICTNSRFCERNSKWPLPSALLELELKLQQLHFGSNDPDQKIAWDNTHELIKWALSAIWSSLWLQLVSLTFMSPLFHKLVKKDVSLNVKGDTKQERLKIIRQLISQQSGKTIPFNSLFFCALEYNGDYPTPIKRFWFIKDWRNRFFFLHDPKMAKNCKNDIFWNIFV